jgi:hypothetical protein
MSSSISFEIIDWNKVPETKISGETGFAICKNIQYSGLRVRIVEYSAGYLADHWCKKGHIVHCLKGEFVSEMQGGTEFRLTEGMSYIVSDELSKHRSKTLHGVTLLIIDGNFLK